MEPKNRDAARDFADLNRSKNLEDEAFGRALSLVRGEAFSDLSEKLARLLPKKTDARS